MAGQWVSSRLQGRGSRGDRGGPAGECSARRSGPATRTPLGGAETSPHCETTSLSVALTLVHSSNSSVARMETVQIERQDATGFAPAAVVALAVPCTPVRTDTRYEPVIMYRLDRSDRATFSGTRGTGVLIGASHLAASRRPVFGCWWQGSAAACHLLAPSTSQTRPHIFRPLSPTLCPHMVNLRLHMATAQATFSTTRTCLQ